MEAEIAGDENRAGFRAAIRAGECSLDDAGGQLGD
jgi:hypothetical protein